MNISWGYKVTILYLAFTGLILFLVSRSLNESIDLVSPDYYEKELKYESQKEAAENNLALTHPAEIWCDARGIKVSLPSDMAIADVSGTIEVFRPSNQQLDFTSKIDPIQGLTQQISADKLVKGLYRVKLAFKCNGVSYYLEKPVVFR